jgi:uncharacterized membrane protein YhiD involved in acid resistance
MRRKTRQIVLVAAVAAVAGFLLAALFWGLSRPAPQQRTAAQQQAAQGATDDATAARDGAAPAATTGAQTNPPPTGDFFTDLFGADQPATTPPRPAEGWRVTVPRIILRLALAAALAAMLAFRPRRDSNIIQRNLYVAQTQILLAVVASSLMMVVGDNAARAFGIFAAVSLVRFRTNIRDPKEITVLLISLSIGLATGVGRWDLAVILSLFVLPLLWFLEYNEEEQVFRAMELTVKTRNSAVTQTVMQELFRRHGIASEVRQIDPPDPEEPVGCIMYHVRMSLTVSTDQINDEIMEADGENIESIEWDQQKNTAYIYQ